MNPLMPPPMLPRVVRRYILFPLRFVLLWTLLALIFSAIPSCSVPEDTTSSGSLRSGDRHELIVQHPFVENQVTIPFAG